MADLVVTYAPWRMTFHEIEDHFAHRWVIDYKPHPIRSQVWQYIDIDPAAQR